MLACVDVDYRPDGSGVAACLLFEGWSAQTEQGQVIERIAEVAPYEPGAFYKRELPCVLAVLARAGGPFEAVVIDGYVWLDAEGRKGLGAHLHQALGGGVPVVGVAKTPFAGATSAAAVLRGGSKHPLWVTSVGLPLSYAAERVRSMAGPHRLPTLLKKVDRVCRDA